VVVLVMVLGAIGVQVLERLVNILAHLGVMVLAGVMTLDIFALMIKVGNRLKLS
jgi:hypothetical protein